MHATTKVTSVPDGRVYLHFLAAAINYSIYIGYLLSLSRRVASFNDGRLLQRSAILPLFRYQTRLARIKKISLCEHKARELPGIVLPYIA